jgi:hypothetical protein
VKAKAWAHRSRPPAPLHADGVSPRASRGGLTGAVFSAQVSTDLPGANEWIVARLDGDDRTRAPKEGFKRASSPLGGSMMRRWATVTSRHRGGMVVAPLDSYRRTCGLTMMNPLDRRPVPWQHLMG